MNAMKAGVRLLVIAVLLLLTALPGFSQSTGMMTNSVPPNDVTIHVIAEVTQLWDECQKFDGLIELGDAISGTYTYNLDAEDADPQPNVGTYRYDTPPYGFDLASNNLVFQTDPENVDFLVSLYDDFDGGDSFHLISYGNRPLANGILVELIQWQLDDPTSTALSSTDLPAGPPYLEDWDPWYGLTVEDVGYYDPPCPWGIRSQVTSASLVPTSVTLSGFEAETQPAPGSTGLPVGVVPVVAGAALAMAYAFRRR